MEHGPWSAQAMVVGVHWLSCPAECVISLDQRSNQCIMHGGFLTTGPHEKSLFLKKFIFYQRNISCKDGLDKGQKWYGPNSSRRY